MFLLLLRRTIIHRNTRTMHKSLNQAFSIFRRDASESKLRGLSNSVIATVIKQKREFALVPGGAS